MVSLKKIFNLKLERSEDLVILKMNITNPVTSFMYPKLKVTNPSFEKICEQTADGTEDNETWWGKNQAKCYVVQVMYLETLQKTMGILRIEPKKLHIGAMYIGVDESDTIGFDKMCVNNKETIINNYDIKLVPKIQGQIINYENNVTQKWSQKNIYQKPLQKNDY